MKNDEVTINISLEEAARRYALEQNCCFIGNELITELLKDKNANRKMMFDPKLMLYQLNSK